VNSEKLYQLLERNLILHIVIEREVESMPFGQITFNFVVKDGVVDLTTLNIVRNKRLRYTG